MELTYRLRTRLARIVMVTALTGVLGVALAACGSEPAPTPTATTAASAPVGDAAGEAAGSPGGSETGGSADATQVAVTLKEWAVELPQAELSAGKYSFVVANDGQFVHNMVITGDDQVGRTPNFKKGDGPKTLEVDLVPGTYTVLCDIPGHPEQGMKTELVVK